MAYAIGIDLGTTNSAAAICTSDGNPDILINKEGGRTTPSVFAITKTGQRIVGKSAVNQEISNADNTLRSVKRKMGSNDKIIIKEQSFTPEEISAEILKKIKLDCEAILGDVVNKAVITVPAYFNSDQRQATKDAGAIAGLEVLRVINEPTAAALAYGLGKNKNETVLVYDLGGGTFDVTVLKITDDNMFEVKSTAGDTYLGGDDFDKLIYDRLINEIHDNFDKSLDKSAQVRLREAAENAKIQLTSSDSVEINLPYLYINDDGPVNLQYTLTREIFEKDIEQLLLKTKYCVEQAIKDAGIKKTDINEVIFVGGSTRIPIIAKYVKEWIGLTPNKSVNPDEAVALGAAIQAAVLSGHYDEESAPILLDVIPITLGIETQGGVLTPMIGRNTTIPAERVETFSTVEDAQTQVGVRVYQGERPRAIDNKKLGEFYLKDIPPAPRGVAKVDVIFDVDANGILSVTAKDKATQREQTVVIQGTSNLTSEEIKQIILDAETHAEEDALFQERAEALKNLETLIIQVSDLIRVSGHLFEEDTLSDLKDTKDSLEKAREYENVEVITSLVTSAKESVMEAGKILYEKAELVTKQANDNEDVEVNTQ